MKNGLQKYFGRTLGFMAFPGIGVLLAFAAWPLSYPVAYIFFPFLGYGETSSGILGIKGTTTIFAEQQYGWYFSFGYLVLLAAVAVWTTRKISLSKALLSFVFIFGLGAVVVHGVMFTFGYHYYVETP
jgi:hypothetical protein